MRFKSLITPVIAGLLPFIGSAAVRPALGPGNPPRSQLETIELQNECSDDALKMLNLVSTYARTAANGSTSESDEAFEKIRLELGRVDRDHSICSPFIFNTYVATSVFILHVMVRWSPGTTVSQDFVPDDYYRGLLRIVSILAQRQVFRPLTPELRKNWGGLYDQELVLNDRTVSRVMGVYTCGSGAIYLDPSLRPYDLAATAIHEIDHLFRDKFGNADDPIEDELIASMRASWAQFRLKRDRNRTSSKQTLDPKIGYFQNLVNDLQLFREDGPLQAAWSRIVKTFSLDKGATLDEFFLYLGDARVFDHFSGVVDVIANAYSFDPRGKADALREGFETNAWKLDPLSRFEQSLQASDLRVFRKFVRPASPRDYMLLYNTFGSLLTSALIFSDYYGDSFDPVERKIVNALEGPSLGCLKRIENEKRPGVEGGRPGVEGGRPGVEGGRPGVEGGRPCLHLTL